MGSGGVVRDLRAHLGARRNPCVRSSARTKATRTEAVGRGDVGRTGRNAHTWRQQWPLAPLARGRRPGVEWPFGSTDDADRLRRATLASRARAPDRSRVRGRADSVADVGGQSAPIASELREPPAGPPSALDAVLAAARATVGRSNPELDGRRIPTDCSGYVRGLYTRAGVDLFSESLPGDNGVRAILRWVERHGLFHRHRVPVPGDLVFFNNSYDRNGDGRLNDPLTHVGLVRGGAARRNAADRPRDEPRHRQRADESVQAARRRGRRRPAATTRSSGARRAPTLRARCI